MVTRSSRSLAAATAFVAFVVTAALVAWGFALTSGQRVALFAGMVFFGLAAAALTWHLLRPNEPHPGEDADEGVLALRQAAARLPRGALLDRPLVLVLGPGGSTKTTVVTRGALNVEKLAGDAVGTGPEAPTRAVNVWLGDDAVVMEAAGAYLGDRARLRRLFRAIRPPHLAAALGSRTPAPRAVVLCIPCDVFDGGDAGRQVEALAPVLRDALADGARETGADLPVYVLFTRADRIPFFESWAAPLTRDEIRVPLGAALPWEEHVVGVHAERTRRRLEEAFAQLVAGMATRRVDLLTRERDLTRRLEAFEVPREVGKLSAAAITLLVDATRPAQIGPVPVLRGFWFTGARPVYVQGATGVAPPVEASVGRDPSATFVVTHGSRPDASARIATRKVPEWVFLDRFFSHVVLADEGTRTVAGGSVRVARLRRAVLVGGLAAIALAAAGVVTSWIGNHRLAARVAAAMARATTARTNADERSALAALDALRATIDTLAALDSAGPPLNLGLGLWRGPALLDAAIPAWAATYRARLHDGPWTTLVDTLRTLATSADSGADYARGYDMLRTYLVGTTEPARSDAAFVTPTLLALWDAGTMRDTALATLARRQFDTYAALQRRGRLWRVEADTGLVAGARSHLARFAGIEPIYAAMLAEVARRARGIRVDEVIPQAAGLLTPGLPAVEAAFTSDGWRAMQAVLGDADPYFRGETWVVGDRSAVAGRDRRQDLADLRARYAADYAGRWRTLVGGAAVVRPTSLRDAAARLGRLGGAQSPLLALLALTARNTSVDPALARAFQPVHLVTPPKVEGRVVSEANMPWVTAVVALQGAVEQVSNLPPGTDSAAARALKDAASAVLLQQAAQALTATRGLAQGFTIDPDASAVGMAVSSLLEAPISGAVGALRSVAAMRVPRGAAPPSMAAGGGGGGGGGAAPPPAKSGAALAAQLNVRGRELCKAFDRIAERFPFSPTGPDARLADVDEVLSPAAGLLWQFHDERLVSFLTRQGDTYVAKPADGVTLAPAFVNYFSRAAQLSRLLYPDGAAAPALALTLQASTDRNVAAVTLQHGDQTARVGARLPAARLAWPASGPEEARLTIAVGREQREIARETGPWALFRLAARGSAWAVKGGAARASFNAKPQVQLEFAVPGGFGAPVLVPGVLDLGAACVAQVTQP